MDAPKEICNRVEKWFEKNGRHLVFRETRDPYAVWISETMLQQTTTAAADGYYRSFMNRFPNATALAEASIEEVLSYWAGLGYYRRAHNLHKAAKIVSENYNGCLPETHKELLDLPGVGRYTAGAVGSIALGLHTPIVEANTRRVLARLFAISDGDAKLWEKAELLVKYAKNPRSLNLGLMDLGAEICGKVPICKECPVKNYCTAYKTGKQTEYPKLKERRETVEVSRDCFVLTKGDQVAVRRIPDGEWHHGMFEFPAFNTDTSGDFYLSLRSGIANGDFERKMTVRYVVTHHKISMDVWFLEMDFREKLPDGYVWKNLSEISELPMGTAQRKVARYCFQHFKTLTGNK